MRYLQATNDWMGATMVQEWPNIDGSFTFSNRPSLGDSTSHFLVPCIHYPNQFR